MNLPPFTLRIGLGTFPFSGVFRDISQSDAEAIVDLFIAQGGQYIETAPLYAVRSVILPDILSNYSRESYFLATKCVTGQDIHGAKMRSGRRDFLLWQCESEAKRFRTDHLDLIQTHAVPSDTSIAELGGTLQEILDLGLAKHVGVSNVTLPQLRAFCDVVKVEFVQIRHSLLHTEEHHQLVEFASENAIVFNPYQVIERGQLASTPTNAATWRATDLRHAKPEYTGNADAVIRQWVMEVLGPIAEQSGLSIEGLAVAWAVAQPAVALPVVGATRADQLLPLFAGARTQLSGDTVTRVNEAVRAFESDLGCRYGAQSLDVFRGLA